MRYVEISTVPPKVLDAFIRLLYCASASMMVGAANEHTKQYVTALAGKASEIDELTGTSIVEILKAYANWTDADEDDAMVQLKAARKALGQEIGSDKQITYTQLDQYKAGISYMLTQSEGALRKLFKLAPALNDPSYVKAFAFQANSQSDFTKPLMKIVKAATGRKDSIVLNTEEFNELKASYPATAKEYRRLRGEFNLVWKDELRNYVSDNGGALADFQGAVDFLDSQGIQHTLPEGYEGMVNANGQLFTTAGKAVKGGVGTAFRVVMNPKYDPDKDDSFIFTTVNKATGEHSGYGYSVDYKTKASSEKFDKVTKLMSSIDGIRKKWFPMVKAGDNSDDSIAATLLELTYMFSARIGSPGNSTDGKATQGMSTLLVKNIKDNGNKVVIKYPGKKGVVQTHVIDATTPEGKLLARNVRQLIENKANTDYVFTTADGKKRIGAVSANKLFERLGSPAGVHKIRHVRGTKLLQQLITENEDKIFNRKKPFTQAEAEATFKALATKVGSMLGHVTGVGEQQKTTPMTAIQNYLEPTVMEAFFDRLGLRAPRWISKE